MIILGAENEIDERDPAKNFGPLGLCYTAAHCYNRLAAASRIHQFYLAERTKLGEQFFDCLFANVTRVEDYQIRFVGLLDGKKSERRQDLEHARRVVDVHLATVRLDKHALCQVTRALGGECSNRHQAASLETSAVKFRGDTA